MQTMLIGDIKIPERVRKSRNKQKFEELKRSIREDGLFHAIVITEGNALVAGETRLLAISELYGEDEARPIFYDGQEVPIGHVPFTFTHQTDEAAILRIEIEENSRREQLSPTDEASALARLHELLQAGAPTLPGTTLQKQVTYQETAAELGKITGESKSSDAQKISDSILVDKFKDIPEVAKAKTFTEAVRAAKKAAERTFRGALGTLANDKPTPVSRHRVFAGDCLEIVEELADGFVDVIIADPPYGMGADKFGDQSLVGHTYKDDRIAFLNVVDCVAKHASRICKPDAAFFIFCDIGEWKFLEEYLSERTDFYIWPTPLIWHKPNRGHAPQPDRGPSRRYETILYGIRGERKVRKVGSDVLSYNVPDNREHGAGKPVELYQELLSWIVYPGDVVLDPCAGSGTVIPASENLDCAAIAIEQDPASLTLCREKLDGKS